jgi:hypothetical protein
MPPAPDATPGPASTTTPSPAPTPEPSPAPPAAPRPAPTPVTTAPTDPTPVAPVPVPPAPAPAPPTGPSPAPAGPRAPSGRTLAIALGGIGLVAVVVVGAWFMAGRRPGEAAPSATAAAAAAASATSGLPAPAVTAAETPVETPTPTPSPEPTEAPVPTEVPTPTPAPSPGIPSIIGETPAEAVAAFLLQRGVDFAGICASVDPATAPAGAYCADLFEERVATQVWRAGPVASEADTWLLVALTELGWSVADFAPIDDPSRPPF